MYDPLVDDSPPSTHILPDSFWATQTVATEYEPLNGEHHTDVAIIGGGYTGLSCAMYLAEHYQVECTVIEANQPGWGCSGRNGGFVLPGSGRLSLEQMSNKWGITTAKAVYAEFSESVERVAGLINQGIDCDKIQGGYLKLAHQEALVKPLHKQARLLSQAYGDSIRPLNAADVERDFVAGVKAYGGVYYPDAFAINPLQFCQGLANCAEQKGATLFAHSPVLDIQKCDNKHVIRTHKGNVIANTVIYATNGYGQRNLTSSLRDRMFPVISSIIVTEPLNKHQLAAIGMREGLMVMDTRALKYYYRILPDNRLLFGGRGAIKGARAKDTKYLDGLTQGLTQTFPRLKGITVCNFWSGWVSVSLDDYPRIYHDKDQGILYSGGYCGAGLAFSVQAGKRLAQLLKEPEKLPDLPYWQSPLRKFPFASLRRPALQAFYWWQGLKQK